MAKTIIKKTTQHCVVAISGTGAETINISTELLANDYEVVSSPKVNIRAIFWAVPTGNATIARNSVTLWSLTGSDDMQFNGWNDNRENGTNIVITPPGGGGTVIVELIKVSGYGDLGHRNPLDATTTTAAP